MYIVYIRRSKYSIRQETGMSIIDIIMHEKTPSFFFDAWQRRNSFRFLDNGHLH